jgi:SPP1 gp7 family putative phage head morphogenesis protein
VARRPTFAERVAQTAQLAPIRQRAQKRLSRAQREALAPTPPAAALAQYSAVMDTYAARVASLVERLVLARLPVVGSGDGLDLVALDRGLEALDVALAELADRSRRSSTAAAKRAAQHARLEAQRILDVSIPKNEPRIPLIVHDFADLGVKRLRLAGQAQVARIRKAIAEHQEGDSLRADIQNALWVSRQRGQMIARDVVHGVQTDLIAGYSLAVGAETYVWCTRRDERVRHGHSVLDGKTFRWDTPPFDGTGNYKPGQAPGCRCRALPVAPAAR